MESGRFFERAVRCNNVLGSRLFVYVLLHRWLLSLDLLKDNLIWGWRRVRIASATISGSLHLSLNSRTLGHSPISTCCYSTSSDRTVVLIVRFFISFYDNMCLLFLGGLLFVLLATCHIIETLMQLSRAILRSSLANHTTHIVFIQRFVNCG